LDENVTLANLHSLARSIFSLEGIAFEIFCDKELVTDKHLEANQNLRIVACDSALMQLEKQANDIHDMKWELVREQLTKLRDEITDLRSQNHNLESRQRMLEDGLNYERLTRQSRAEDLEARLKNSDLGQTLSYEKFVDSVEDRFQKIQTKHDIDVSSIELSLQEVRTADEEFRRQVTGGMVQFQNSITEHHEITTTAISAVREEGERNHAKALEAAVDKSKGEAARIEDLLKRDTAKIQASLLNLRHDLNALTETSNNESSKLEKEDVALREKIRKVEENLTKYESVCSSSAIQLAQTIDRLEAKVLERNANLATNMEQIDFEWHAEANRIVDDVALKLDATVYRIKTDIQHYANKFAPLEPKSELLEKQLTSTQNDLNALRERIESISSESGSSIGKVTKDLAEGQAELLKAFSQLDGRLELVGNDLDVVKGEISAQMEAEIKKLNDDLGNRISIETAARVESATSQQTWVKLWSEEFRQAYDQKSEESEKKVNNTFQRVCTKLDALATASERQLRNLQEAMEKETVRNDGCFADINKSLHTRCELLTTQLNDSTQLLQEESRSRWNQAVLAIDESSKQQSSADEKISEMDAILNTMSSDMGIMRKHLPMVFHSRNFVSSH